MKSILIFISIQFFVSSCFNQHQLKNKSETSYNDAKSKFDNKLYEHFPEKITSKLNTVICNTNLEKNDVGLFLCEYEVEEGEIKRIKNYLSNNNVSFYTSKDTCLLIINRFETMETYENLEIVTSIDSSKLNNKCYQNKNPIPNFIDINNPIKYSEIHLNNDYTIYVLEAKSGVSFKDYDLLPNPQMPENWKNGFSRGIAINEKEKTIIYWGVIW